MATRAWWEGGWGRTAVLQFKEHFGGVATERHTLTQVKTLFD